MLGSVDWVLLFATGFLLFIGQMTLQHQGNDYADKQAGFLVAGVLAALIFWRIPYTTWTHKIVLPVIYFINIALLIAVMLKGHSAMGAQRWLAIGPITIQPSEIAKLVVIFTLSAWLAYKPVRQFRDCFFAIAIIVIPAVLVFKQPDLGTSLTFGAVYFGMLFWSGAGLMDLLVLASPVLSLVLNAVNLNWWYAYLAGLGGLLILFWRRRTWPLWLRLMMVTGVVMLNMGMGEARPHLWGVLKEYQQKRLTSFVNPYADPRGSGYHILQSLIAIGSGGVIGAGLGKGNQSQGAFIPERHTDFIFAVVGEELGFRITAAIVFAYFLICMRAVMIAYQARENPAGSLMAIGIMCMFLFHVFLNIGMTIGIMPVAGVPLPFLSYGGTALITDLVSIGLLLSIRTAHPKTKQKDDWW
ncbi:MAG: rod shape-determining protein RodA [Candidatus Obscuribacterales bacterium]|nr:rod shape-determining protein RodA [Candidatus Obscuribacterales bacterium]